MRRLIIETAWVVTLCVLGWVDIEVSFRPIALFGALVVVFLLWLYRRVVASIMPRFLVTTRVLIISAITVGGFIFIGMLLNRPVERSALETVAAINAYHDANGVYPASVSELKTDKGDAALRRNYLGFGSHYYYERRADAFSFGYQIFPFGEKFWNNSKMRFEDSLD
jgi:hypothetical protein